MNEIQNPDFENKYLVPEDHPEWDNCLIAPDWTMWFDGPIKPEYKAALPTDKPEGKRIFAGSQAQQWFNSYNTHRGGVYQRVQVTVGALVSATVRASVWSASGDDPAFSGGPQGNGKYQVRVGIDPKGGTDPNSPDVIWGDGVFPYDVWMEVFSPQVQCNTGHFTLFIEGNCVYPVKNNNCYIDSASLKVIPGGNEPPPVGDGSFDSIRVRMTTIIDEAQAILSELDVLEAGALWVIPI